MPDFGAYLRKVLTEWTGQREHIAQLEETGQMQAATIEAQTEQLARLKTHISKSVNTADELQAYAVSLERKFILPPPSGGSILSESEIVQYLPLPLTTRENSKALVLPLAEWERFAAWAIPRARNIRPYETDMFDCGGLTRVLLGLAEEWAPGGACGWVELTSPRDILHKMVWLLATNGTMVLRYIDATPRNIVPWPEGIFAEPRDTNGTPWQLGRLGF